MGAALDPWQCDAFDALMEHDNLALRACHGPGKTTFLAWAINWFTMTRPLPKVPTTAPTFNKQVRDILWAEVHKWYRGVQVNAPWLANQFKLNTTRLMNKDYPDEWFAVGIASSEPLNIEGYHSQYILVIFDEAKAIKPSIWQSVQGMRTTHEAKLLAASTPGGPIGDFFKVFNAKEYRSTWKTLFIIHPEPLKAVLKRPETPYKKHKALREHTYYSNRISQKWVDDRKAEWGENSPVYIARVIGDFPMMEGDLLIPYGWIANAADREEGIGGPRVVSCDIARYGRDRTVILAGEGGRVEYGETIARSPEESWSPDAKEENIGDDPTRPRYRGIDATADACQRVRIQQRCDWIVVDDTGLNGVADMLRRRGENVIPINFGSAPTDRPRDEDERKRRQEKHIAESHYLNIKAQMGWECRRAFENNAIGLALLPPQILDPLMAQASMMMYEWVQGAKLKLIDPDDTDEFAAAAGAVEGKKSPDHFHSLMLFWWVAGKIGKALTPQSGAPANIPNTIKRLGISRRNQMPGSSSVGFKNRGQIPAIRAGVVGGMGQHVRGAYR